MYRCTSCNQLTDKLRVYSEDLTPGESFGEYYNNYEGCPDEHCRGYCDRVVYCEKCNCISRVNDSFKTMYCEHCGEELQDEAF